MMRRRVTLAKKAIVCPVLTLCLSACSDSGGTATGGAGNSATGSTSNGHDCDVNGIHFGMVGAFSHTSRDAQLYVWDGAVPGILGVRGMADGKSFMFIRSGDAGDGNLGEVMTYDVSQYPYNISYSQLDDPTQAATCDPGPGACSGFFAFGGSYTVTQLTPTYQASFSLTMLTEGGGKIPGAAIAGTVSGCIAAPNP